MYDVNDAEPYGHTVPELRRSVLQQTVRQIELERDRRRGLVPEERRQRRSNVNTNGLHAAFARAAREQRELQRLKASGKPFACLDFHPERLGRDGYDVERERSVDTTESAAA